MSKTIYKPERKGIPQYFVPMLDDEDRNRKYEDAIRQAIDDFKRRENRAPVVVDLGCGTGMLTLFALRHGAAHVYSVDVNADMVAMCKQVIERSREPSWGTQVTVCGTFHPKTYPSWMSLTKGYDMLVSEILGTTGTSESMHEYVKRALVHIRKFKGKVYCIPQELTVTARWYDAQDMFASESSSKNLPLLTALSEFQCWDGVGKARIEWLDTVNTVSLHHMKCCPVSETFVVCTESYVASAVQTRAAAWRCTLHSPTPTTVFAIEWVATLWGDSTRLSNTLNELAHCLSPRNADARTRQWGMMYYRPFRDNVHRDVTLDVAVSSWPMGVPTMTLEAHEDSDAFPRKRPRVAKALS